jgi:hypothetical protein
MMIKFATLFTLALGVAAHKNGEGGRLRGLKGTDVVESLKEPNSLDMLNDNTDIEELKNRKVVEVFDPSVRHDMERDNGYDGSGSSWCYDYYPGAIRTSDSNANGYEGKDYHLYKDKSESWCQDYCSSHDWCKAYEYKHDESRCEMWKHWYGYHEDVDGFKSYVKKRCQDTESENGHDQSSWCFDYYPGAIRTSDSNANGYEGTDYHLYEDKSESWCKDYCSSYDWCKAYEYEHDERRCELWKEWYGYHEDVDGFKSYVKKHCGY